MEKKDIKFIIIFIFVVGISFIYLFQATYAKYRKQITTEVNANVASWNIKINDEAIANKKKLANSITPIFDENEYVKANTLAPGVTGHFDIIIDSFNVDVDFTYEITASLAEDTDLKDFKITGYELNDSGTINKYDSGVTGDLVKNTKNTKIRFYVAWIDDDTNEMDNSEDTTYAVNHNNVIYNLTIKFTQKK